MSQSRSLPVLFISHGGGPWPWLEFEGPSPYEKLAQYLRGVPKSLPSRPKAILMISGHWEESQFTVMTHPHPPMLYDYGGFPEHTYRIQYAAPGSPSLAGRVHTLLSAAGVAVSEDSQRGFDHGVFSPMAVMVPDAEIPIVQLSMKRGYDSEEHIKMGAALAPLRDEGILIIGSGLSYHNLRAFGPAGAASSQAFDAWLTAAVCAPTAEQRTAQLLQWSHAPSARQAHPREDHLVPLMVAAGAAGEDLGVKCYGEQFMGLEVSGYQFG